jgi:uncharacterized protein YndB with AHSA1/START domain
MRGRPGPAWNVRVNVPPEKAYDYVVDVMRHPEWGMDEMTMQAADGQSAPAVGSRYKAEGTLFSRRNPSTVTITALEPPRRIEFEAEDASSITGHVFTFERQDGGTLITRQIYAVKQPFYGPVLFLILRGAVNKNFNGALEKLKQRLETPAAV